jgi:pimeloyl-ACP methyl ester carboxylesterase
VKLRVVPPRQLTGTGPRGPLGSISTRAANKGGDVLAEARVEPPQLLRRPDDGYLLLVHGYANSTDDAVVVYRALTARLSGDWPSRAIDVFWPGDGSSPHEEGVAESWFASRRRYFEYAWQPMRATDSAQLIADRIAEAVGQRAAMKAHEGATPRPLVLHVVAHSLGCRLTLELLRELRQSQGLVPGVLDIRLVVLMAAAVPLYMVAKGGPLHRALDMPRRVIIYHSKRDRALGLVFRAGQSFESVAPSWPLSTTRRALGRQGIAPEDGRRDVYQTGLGHRQYWTHRHVASDIDDALKALPGPPVGPLIRSRFAK